MTLDNPGRVLGQAIKCGQVITGNGTTTLRIGFLGLKREHGNKQTMQNQHRFPSSTKRPSIITKMKDNIKIDST